MKHNTQNYGSMTLTLEPPYHTGITVPEYIQKVIHMYESSRISNQECIITKIIVDRRGPGQLIYEELCREMGPLIEPMPLPNPRPTLPRIMNSQQIEDQERIETCPSKHSWARSEIRDQKECLDCPATWTTQAYLGGYDYEGNFLGRTQ